MNTNTSNVDRNSTSIVDGVSHIPCPQAYTVVGTVSTEDHYHAVLHANGEVKHYRLQIMVEEIDTTTKIHQGEGQMNVETTRKQQEVEADMQDDESLFDVSQFKNLVENESDYDMDDNWYDILLNSL